MKNPPPVWLAVLMLASIHFVSARLLAAPFTAGNLVVYRIGTGTGSLVNTGNPVFLDEYTSSGTLVQSIALPTAVNGSQKRLIASGTAGSEGQMTLSADGRYLVLPGYDATPPHSSSLTGTASAAVNRVIGRVDALANIDTSTALTDAYSANNFRGVCTSDGTQFWIAGNGNSTTGGVRHVASLGATTSLQLSTTNNNLRQPAVFGGQLYVSSGNGSTARLGPVGSGLPNTTSQIITSLPGYPVNLSPNAFVLLDLSDAVAGVDTLYIADDDATNGGILKYSFDGTTWTARGSSGLAADAYRGLTASVFLLPEPGVVIYAVRKGGGGATGGGEVVSLPDTSGSTGTLSGTPTLIATAGANTALRGIAFAPQRPDLLAEVSGPSGFGPQIPPTSLPFTREPFLLHVRISNSGGGTAYQVGAQLTLPAGLSYVSDSAISAGFQSSITGQVLTFNGGILSAHMQANLTVQVVTEIASTYTIPAGALVVDPLGLVDEADEANNNSSTTPSFDVSHAADLKVSLGAPATGLTGSAGFDYTLIAENEGLADAASVRVSFTQPAGLSFANANGAGFNASEDSGVVHLDGSLLADSSATLIVHVTASADGAYTAPIGAATIGPVPLNLLVDSDPSNNTSPTAATTTLLTSDLAITHVANGIFQAGDSASYTITVSNIGTGSTQGMITFSENLPAGVTATSLSGTGWAITQGTGTTVSATRNDPLPTGQSYPTLTLNVGIATNAPTSVISTANVSGGGDSITGNNSASATTSVLGAGPGVISLSSASYIANEEDVAVSINLTRTGGRTGEVGVTFASGNDSATSGTDYTSVNTVVTFADDQISRTVLVQLVNDTASEPNEIFNITLSSPSGGASLGAITSASVLLLDPDTTHPKLTLKDPKPNQRIDEGAVTASGEVSDNKQVRRVQVKLNNGTFADAVLTPGNGGKTNFSRPLTPTPGLNTLAVKASDFRGNEIDEVQRGFTYVVKRPLTLNLVSEGSSTVSIKPAEPLTTLELAKTYALTAKPVSGKVWNGWSSPQLTLTEAQRLNTTLTFTMVEGLTITANFADNPFQPSVIGDFSGLVRGDGSTTPAHDNEGAVRIKVTPTGRFSGTLQIGGASLPFSGVLDTTGTARFGSALATSTVLSRSPSAGYVLAFAVDLNLAGTHKITGTLRRQTREGSAPLSILEANRHAYDGKTPGTSVTETFYTWAMPAQAQTNGLIASQHPQGDSVGAIQISKSGAATLAGVLADGTSFTTSAALSAGKDLPMFASLEKGTGSLNGWLHVDHTRPDTDVSGTSVHWFKPVIAGTHYYPFGWPEGLTLSLLGARFTVPVGESVLPDLAEVSEANALLSFAQGGLTGLLEKELAITSTNVVTKIPVTDPSYDLKLTAKTGQYTGKFDPGTGAIASFIGVILQKGEHRRGFGHFLTAKPKVINGTGLSGVVELKTKFNPRLTLVISEVMSNNEHTIADENGDHSDWLEIYNPGLTEVDLTDWCLTDSASNLAKWRFPAVTLGSKQFVLVWASSKNRRVPGQPLHTNFNLAAGGEYLALVRPDGATVEHEFSPMFPALANDESYGIHFSGRPALVQGATVKYHLPANNSLGTTWTAKEFNDASWTKGKTGLGFGVGVPGFTVRQVAARPTFGGVYNITACEALLALPKGHANILSEATVIAPSINYLGDGAEGRYGDNLPLPNGTAEPYAFKATGTITIPTAGNYVFGLNSDDGGRIKIDGTAVMTDDSNHGPLDNLSAPVNLNAGSHSVEIIMWEGGGGDCVEFFAKAGTDTAWNADFKLVGGPGGLPVVTNPPNSISTVSNVISTNLQSAMQGKRAGCYARLPFTVTSLGSLTGMTLRMRYNDGFVAWLNGTEIARRNAPTVAAYDSAATATRSAAETLTEEEIDLSAQIPLLSGGTNVLSIHGMNNALSDSSFLILPELSTTSGLAANAAFFHPGDTEITATPGTMNGVPTFDGIVAPLVFSQKHGFYDKPLSLAITTATGGASIRYTLDGSTPTATHGTVYSGPLAISKTSIVRAIGYRSDYEPTALLTQSYFFLNDVIRQSANGARPSTGWPAGTVNGQVSDYGMDPDIVNGTNPEIGGVDKVKSALKSIPTISIVTDLPNLFSQDTGIWVNPYSRGEAWERPASVELIGDSGPNGGFDINCGLRLRGGFSRSGDNPKHALRLFFRSEYGASKLNYPLFGDEGVSSFDKIDFRTAQNYSWSFGGDGNNTFMREESTRELQGAMGQPYSKSRYYHLYLNGQYWGLYDSDERPESNFAESYIGGDADDYDTVKGEQDQGYVTGVTDGNLDAWEQLRIKARAHSADPTNANFFAISGKGADGVTPTTDPVLLEVDNLIDYMMLTFWTGNLDGATSAFLGDSRANNWFAFRNRLGTFGGFRFFAHDFEHTFLNVDEDRTGPFPNGNPEEVSTYNPLFIHHDLRPNLEYRMMWADRVQRHLFGDGALVAGNVQARMRARKALLDKVIIAESARWGDSKRGNGTPLNRLDWQNAVNYLIENYVPERGSRVIAQLRADGLYPSFDAPEPAQNGGPWASGQELMITGHGGTMYYTLDGSDPRLIGGELNPAAQVYTSSTETLQVMPLSQTWKYLADGSNQGTAWRATVFDDSTWASGTAELGYGDGDEATAVPYVDVDSIAGGDQKNATTYFRTSFQVTDATGITQATLRVKYDDAVIFYLNGTEVAHSANIGSNPAHNQYSSGGAPNESAYFDFPIDATQLVTGTNVLAAEVHQADSGSSDISLSASLSITRTSTATPLYLIGTGNRTLKVRALNSGEWSALVENTFDVRLAPDMTVAITRQGTFTAGAAGSYSIVASNQGSAASTGPVSVNVILPTGLTLTSLSGTGWTVAGAQATRNDALAAGADYPPLTLVVNIANTAPALTPTTASISGGGEITLGNNSDTDATPIESTGASQILFSAAGYEALEPDSNISITLLRTGSRTGTASVRLRSIDGSAKVGSDYSQQDQVITFAEGEASRSVDIGLNNDGRTETHESFSLSLSEITGAASLGMPNVATARILEADEQAPQVTLTTPTADARVVLPAVILSGSATDNKGLGRVQVALNGGAFTDVLATLDSKGTGAKFNASVPAIAGINTVRVRAVDARGLISNEIVRQFTFVPLRPLTVNILPVGSGEFSISPGGKLTQLEVGKSYTLTAKPKTSLLFDHWSGPSINQASQSLIFTMSEGLVITANFAGSSISAVNAGTYQGLVVSDISLPRRQDNHGMIILNLVPAAVLSGSLKLGETKHPFTGELHPDGSARFGKDRSTSLIIPRAGRASLVLSLQINLSLRTFMGHVGEQTRTSVAPLCAFRGARKRAPLTSTSLLLRNGGKYQVTFTQVNPVAGAPGYPGSAESVLKGTLSKSGVLTLVGTLTDGSKVTASSDLLESNEMVLHELLDAKAGSLAAALDWSEVTPGFTATGGLWFKPVTNQGLFPFGWPEGLTFSIEGEP
ncbi:MAG: Calx-beta domain-containing protein [Verrucomicrobiota bacterium]